MSDPAAELRAACEEVRELREAADVGDLDAVADAYESVARVLDRWEERATDWDDFEGYVEFRNDLAGTLDSVPEDIPESDAFVEADSHVKTTGVSGSLKVKDFEAAREALTPAREYAELREDLEAAERRYRQALSEARKRLKGVESRIEDLERLVELSAVDLDAPVETLREPIETYNEAIRGAFAEYRRETPAREFLEFVSVAKSYPLVDYPKPPRELLEYVRENPAGRHPLPDLLEYAGYSPSKLDHYVDDANLLKRRVSTNRTYLERLSADPLCVEWPPVDREALTFRARELMSVVTRLADESVTSVLRDVQALPRREDYDRLRTAAIAREELSEAERRRVERGVVEEELESARTEKRRLEDVLADCEDL